MRDATFEAEVLPGLEPWARAELERLGARIVGEREGELDFALGSERAEELDALRRVTAVYAVLDFDVPRPKSLLGDEHFRRLVGAVESTARGRRFEGFRFGAAGSDSAVFRRLAAALERATGLPRRPDEGELLLRVRPDPRPGAGGWQVLVRRTPRPLSARAWRVCNLPGGLNACVAAAMIDASEPQRGERVLNLMCGSGTLLVERFAHEAGPPASMVGLDLDPDALRCTARNLAAAGLRGVSSDVAWMDDEDAAPVGSAPAGDAGAGEGTEGAGPAQPDIDLRLADAGTTGLPDASVDVIVSDPPWGDAVGDHARNAALYPRTLDEAARLLAPGGRLVLLSHEVRLMEELLAANDAWRVVREQRVFHGGHWPRLLRLELR